ncbi:alpha-1,2-fucosyltransferase [Alloacidobacterium dinghuense]|uniref:Alpha-1,2-fucosyltransferase n=1 Tax=Alloacidobacterium dinghuense TaxID=2763107 RepID=A0A7G8BDZ3_9BACT|nr:alpha-1,2-fucosyltransferase [Alloacidobacterium dinghuense]QNI30763.1 alpha-1,2-fucosyltransferase [Alloacidobacterium dinghuense]
MDKRSYHKLFRTDAYIHGSYRTWLLATAKRFKAHQESEAKLERGARILVFENEAANNTRFFQSISGRPEEVHLELLRIARPDHIPPVNPHKSFIGIHVRTGDFTRVTDPDALRTMRNVQLPIEWYRSILLSIRKQIGGDVDARVFSDGSAELLRPLLDLPNVSLEEPYSALRDMLELSKASTLISSGSGFSMWAAYLRQVPRICFPNQRREYVVTSSSTIDLEPECETGNDIPSHFIAYIADGFRHLGEVKQFS